MGGDLLVLSRHLTAYRLWNLLGKMKTIKNHTILVIAETPIHDDVASKSRRWTEFLLNMPQALKQNAQVERLCENVWQLPLDKGLPTLCEFLDYGKGYSDIRMRYLFLEGIPEWQLCPPPATLTNETKPS